MKVSRASASVLDGKISEGEYGAGVSFTEGQGLWFLNDGVDRTVNASFGATQESFVLLCDNYVYCSLRLNLPTDGGTVSSSLRNGIQCYRVAFSIGIADGDHPALRGSFLSNTYYFSADDYTCVGFSGERIARSVSEPSIVSKPLSTFTEFYRENGVVTADGVKWNADHYCKNAVFSLEKASSGTLLVAEVKIPLEDVLLSVLPADRANVEALLKDPTATLCGSFSTKVDLDAVSCAVTGVPSDVELPNSVNGETLFDWMKDDFATPVSGVYIPNVVPIPLHWGAVSTVTKEEPAALQEKGSVSTAVASSSSRQGLFQEGSAPALSGESASPSEELLDENDESIFESLPDADSRLPEDTEIIYDEPDFSSEKESQEKSLLSAVLATASGALIFASVMVLCIYFRDRDKQEEKKRQDQSRSGKKNHSKKKNGRRD